MSVIPESHPLRQFFTDMVGRHYAEEIGIRDPQLIAYVAHLLTEFCDAEQLFKIHDAGNRSIDDVGELLLESDPVYGPAPSFDRECLAPLSVQVSEIFSLRMVLGGMWEISARHARA